MNKRHQNEAEERAAGKRGRAKRGYQGVAARLAGAVCVLVIALAVFGVGGAAGPSDSSGASGPANAAISDGRGGGALSRGQSGQAADGSRDESSATQDSAIQEEDAVGEAESVGPRSSAEFQRMLAELPATITLHDADAVEPVEAPHEEGVLLVQVASGISAADLNALFKRASFVATKDVTGQDLERGFVEIALADGVDEAQAATALQATGLVKGAQPNYLYQLMDEGLRAVELQSTSVNDPKASSQWALEKVQAYDAWDIVQVEHAVTVAIMDDGCEVTHEDLADNVVATYNAVDESDDVSHIGTSSHGTHVAGIVAAEANNGVGVAGVSHNAGIFPIQVFDGDTTSTTVIADAYNYVEEQADAYNIHVVNLSVGAPMSDVNSVDRVLIDAIEEAYDNGIVSVCAAGNYQSSNPSTKPPCSYYPADFTDKMVSVINLKKDSSASDGSGVSVSSFSNYNMPGYTTKDISAPGTDILSTIRSGEYGTMSGTSMATPLVAGILALEFAVNPNLTSDGAVAALHEGATDLGDAGWDELTGYGMANAYGALKQLDIGLTGSTSLCVGETTQLSPAVSSTEQWTWSSSDEAVATVDSDGVVHGIGAGTATITAALASDPSVKARGDVTVYAGDLSNATITLTTSTFTYKPGVACEPGVTVYYGEVALDPSSYELSYSNNVNAGTATVIVKGANDYCGEAQLEFTIRPASIAAAQVATLPAQTYDGSKQTPVPSVSLGGVALVEGSDFTVSYADNVNAGTATATMTGIGNFTGTCSKTFTIKRASLAQASLSKLATRAFTGKALEPLPTVTVDGVKLKRNVDYRVSYRYNVCGNKSGVAQVTVCGIGNYTNRATTTFKITAPSVKYRSRVQGSNWQSYVKDGRLSGTTANGKHLQSIAAMLSCGSSAGTVAYRAQVNRAYMPWKTSGGSLYVGSSNNVMRTLQVKLSGAAAKYYDVYYCVRVQGYGWLGWAKNGARAGTAAASRGIQAVKMKVVVKGSGAPASSSSKRAYV